MSEAETLGQRIRRLLKKEKLSQQEVADELNIPRNTVWRWINNQATPESNNLHKLATLLHITVDELLNGAPEQDGWVLHVEIGNTKEDFLNMKNGIKPESVIITSSEGGYLKLGGNYQLWADDKAFRKLIKELGRLRGAVLANGKALGGIKENV